MNAILEAMRTTGSVRSFKPDAVPGEAVRSAIEAARFGPWPTTLSRLPVHETVFVDRYGEGLAGG
jgi:nitroreductase